jgi:hypothetical protein
MGAVLSSRHAWPSRASTSCFVPRRKTSMAGTSPAMTMQRLHSGRSSYATAPLPTPVTRIEHVCVRSPSAVDMKGCCNNASDLPDESSDFGKTVDVATAALGYCAWGCFRYFARARALHLAPLAGRGRIASTDAIRVRGYRSIDGSRPRREAPHPNPLPAKSGARGRTVGAVADQSNLIACWHIAHAVRWVRLTPSGSP